MRLTAFILASLSTFIVPVFTLPETPPVPSHLNITTIATASGKSTLECWQLSAPFVASSQAGTSGAVIAQLGETGATSYTLLPPGFDGGLHNAPAVQYALRSSLSFPCILLFRLLFFLLSSVVQITQQLNPSSGCIRWVAFISGLAVVSLPNSTETATIHGGRNGLILATDTKNTSTLGHKTVYPGNKDTVGIQIPTRDNEIPAHTVLHAGPCKKGEMDQ
ncbi:hypothetical protein IMSHALPRED_002907 [Imshaugia aleurites]|uniref:Small secreted protein n=1 Tax=Imshaugia aleurites TaxID=172621 RepID=A0A8H3J6Z5_9LECA|nr:hypothetical protein IMSHALPRED_002907 [Imshaugia aleurites]